MTIIIFGSLCVSGVFSGIVALLGIRRHSRKGIRTPALVGLILWMLMAALATLTLLALPKFREIQASAALIKPASPTGTPASASVDSTPAPSPQPGATTSTQEPPVYPEGSTRIEDKEFGFSFAVPEGYTAADEKNPDEVHSFKRKFITEPPRVILIKKMEGDYSRRMATAEHFPAPPEGQTSESAVFDWRGRKVGGTRSVDSKRNPPYVVFHIVIPLHKQTMLLEVGGSAQYEAVIQEAVDQILESFAEEPH